MATQWQNECSEIACKILQIKEMVKELDDEE